MADIQRIDPLNTVVTRFKRLGYHDPTYGDPKWHVAEWEYTRSGCYMEYRGLCGYTVNGALGGVRVSAAVKRPAGQHCSKCAKKFQEMREAAQSELQSQVEEKFASHLSRRVQAMADPAPPQHITTLNVETLIGIAQHMLGEVEVHVKNKDPEAAESAEFQLRETALWIIVNRDLSHAQVQQVAQLALSSSYYFPGR